jgi:ankyrin repeat protein
LYAAGTGSKNAVEFLISKGADIEYENGSGKTALMLAVSKNKKEVIDVLKKHGAKR